MGIDALREGFAEDAVATAQGYLQRLEIVSPIDVAIDDVLAEGAERGIGSAVSSHHGTPVGIEHNAHTRHGTPVGIERNAHTRTLCGKAA